MLSDHALMLSDHALDEPALSACHGIDTAHLEPALRERSETDVVGGVKFSGGRRAPESAKQFGVQDREIVGGVGLADAGIHDIPRIGISAQAARTPPVVDIEPGRFRHLKAAQGTPPIAVKVFSATGLDD